MSDQRCGTCRWLLVAPNAAGRRVVRKATVYRCTFEPKWPALPDSIIKGPEGFMPPSRMFMGRDYGTGCPTWEKL